MKEEDAVNLEIAVWMSIVIMAFRTSFYAEGSHRTINPYFKVLNTIIRRKLCVILMRYLEQECVCQNHVQCDIYPNILTSEINPSQLSIFSTVHPGERNFQDSA